MARFRYVGEPAWASVVAYGPCTKIRTPMADGSTQEYDPVSPATEFVVGQDIGYDITDATAYKSLKYNSRFEEIV